MFFLDLSLGFVSLIRNRTMSFLLPVQNLNLLFLCSLTSFDLRSEMFLSFDLWSKLFLSSSFIPQNLIYSLDLALDTIARTYISLGVDRLGLVESLAASVTRMVLYAVDAVEMPVRYNGGGGASHRCQCCLDCVARLFSLTGLSLSSSSNLWAVSPLSPLECCATGARYLGLIVLPWSRSEIGPIPLVGLDWRRST